MKKERGATQTPAKGAKRGKARLCLTLFLTFFKIGLFTFGGGYAMLALIENECVGRKKWLTGEDMLDITAVAEATPGPIAINCATFTGFRQARLTGAVCATLGVILPSFIVIYVISMFLDTFMALEAVANAFRGIRVAVGLLIITAGLRMLKKANKRAASLIILALAALAVLVSSFTPLNISVLIVVLASGLAGYAAFGRGGEARP